MSVQSIGGVNAVDQRLAGELALPAQNPAIELPKQETKAEAVVKPDVLEKAVLEANEVFSKVRPDIQFVIDEVSNEVLIKLVEPGTGEVINQYPTEQAVAISNAIAKVQQETIERQFVFKTNGEDFAGLLLKQKS